MTSIDLKYRRVILKLSGESLADDGHFGISPKSLERAAIEIKEMADLGVEIGIVVGGGNLFRGSNLATGHGIHPMTCDHIGMLATVINALAVRDALESVDVPAEVMTAVPMPGFAPTYNRRFASHMLSKKRVLIFGGGTGNPLVTTDSAASLRAIELGADLLMKATNVDGIYNDDPSIDPDAKILEHVTYDQALHEELGVMDLTSFCQCRDHNVPLRVFNVGKVGAMVRIVRGETEGTLVDAGE